MFDVSYENIDSTQYSGMSQSEDIVTISAAAEGEGESESEGEGEGESESESESYNSTNKKENKDMNGEMSNGTLKRSKAKKAKVLRKHREKDRN
jgi:hypothetical protein